MKCPICAANSSHALVKDERPYSRCEQCKFLFHRPEAEGAQTGALSFYDEKYWEMERQEALRREKEDSFIRAIELLYLSCIRVETVLDFGCGPGLTVQLLRDKLGLDAVGVDISADFEETAYLHRCDLADLLDKYPAGHFDAIYSIEVFEHLEDPKRTLSTLHSLLKPGGKILINTGTQEYLSKYDPGLSYIDPLRRGHISIYSLESFAAMAAAFGYEAGFMADRKYAVILSPAGGGGPFPCPGNLERIRMLGDWVPPLMQEYMRLVCLEDEFEKKSRWLVQLLEELESLRAERSRLLAAGGSPESTGSRKKN
jgi:SAM-dependent methyltransferase